MHLPHMYGGGETSIEENDYEELRDTSDVGEENFPRQFVLASLSPSPGGYIIGLEKHEKYISNKLDAIPAKKKIFNYPFVVLYFWFISRLHIIQQKLCITTKITLVQ